MRLPATRLQKKTPLVITSSDRCQSSTGKSSDGPIAVKPALLTSTSSGPRSASAAAIARSTSASLATSQG